MIDPNYDQLLESALVLSPNLRSMLVEQLVASLDDECQAEVDSAWGEEVERRLMEVESGQVSTESSEAIISRLRSRSRS
ncbi:MAG: addiction module protein [Phormidium sp.]